MQRRITRLLYRCDIDDLPERLRRYQAIDWHTYETYLRRVKERGELDENDGREFQ